MEPDDTVRSDQHASGDKAQDEEAVSEEKVITSHPEMNSTELEVPAQAKSPEEVKEEIKTPTPKMEEISDDELPQARSPGKVEEEIKTLTSKMEEISDDELPQDEQGRDQNQNLQTSKMDPISDDELPQESEPVNSLKGDPISDDELPQDEAEREFGASNLNMDPVSDDELPQEPESGPNMDPISDDEFPQEQNEHNMEDISDDELPQDCVEKDRTALGQNMEPISDDEFAQDQEGGAHDLNTDPVSEDDLPQEQEQNVPSPEMEQISDDDEELHQVVSKKKKTETNSTETKDDTQPAEKTAPATPADRKSESPLQEPVDDDGSDLDDNSMDLVTEDEVWASDEDEEVGRQASRSPHSHSRRFECKMCGRSFLRQSFLSAHLERRHGSCHCPDADAGAGEWDLDCCELTVGCETACDVDVEKPTCPHCGERYVDQELLRYHLKLTHGSGPFACPECDRTFLRRRQLLLHLKIHSDKPYACDVCRRSFALVCQLLRHERIHEPCKTFQKRSSLAV